MVNVVILETHPLAQAFNPFQFTPRFYPSKPAFQALANAGNTTLLGNWINHFAFDIEPWGGIDIMVSR
jgi:hypothetical protein